MLWKKRWFVLSEYCLFYYKGPEEEKLLGSILLPSYRVTICRPEDKVAKKFAFKAEHANMRTYLFAADSRERMNQWVNALTLATLLQDPNPGGGEAPVALEIAGPADGERSARPSVSSISSILNQSADDSDSGFHGFQSRDDPSHASNNNSSPNSANTASFPNLSTNGSSGTGQDGQPHPLINGWMQQPYAQAGTSQQHQVQHQVQHPGQLQVQHQVQHPVQHQGQQVQHQVQHQGQHQVQHQVQVQHQHQHQVNPPSSPQQQFQLQVHPHQHLPHQYKQQVHQQQQVQQAAGPSNVQTVQPMPRNFGQPVYANAPPKPRRLTDGSNDYSTPSPDPDYRRSPVSPDVRVAAKSPIAEYERNGPVYVASTRMPGALRTDRSGLNYGYGQVQSTERRTPDTYGRSAKPRGSRPSGDYEDVYAGPQLYQRPAGPVGYTKAPTPAPIPIPGYGQQHPQMYVPAPSNGQPRQVRVQPPPRPHSADFLEYEATRRPHQQVPTFAEDLSTQQRRPQRPKSSLDIVNPSDVSPSDGYFYSEERYAAQMRQSAVYLHQTPQQHQQQRNQSLSRAATPSKTTSTRDVEPAIVPGLDGSCPALKRSLREHGHQQQVLSQSLQRYSEMSSNEAVLRRSLRERSYEMPLQEGGTVPRRAQRDYEVTNGRTSMGHPGHAVLVGQGQYHHSGHGSRRWNEQVLQHQQQQFSRSASARLPRTRHPAGGDPEENPYEQSPSQDARDGERKIQQREESMKRLLEWKQRMLQSPLTRKPSGSAHRSSGPNELSSYYKRQALLDLAAHEATLAEARHSRRRDDGHRSHPRSKSSDGRRSANNVSRYNSYSSDDEASGSGSVIGRDPLPPRAVSTSQLPQRTLTQPPAGLSTLPLSKTPSRAIDVHRQPLPVHQSTPQASGRQLDRVEILRAASSGDVRLCPTSSQEILKDLPRQRVVSPAGVARTQVEHRVSSPSDSEMQPQSPGERRTSPASREVDRGGGPRHHPRGSRPGKDLSQKGQQRRPGSAGGLVQVSAGELLGRTHEELVLLLIQLRRQSATLCKAMETCHMEIEAQARLAELDTPRRLENWQKLEELQKHLMDLEKQYEKGKPLVNLVDNMVKLGSLYNHGNHPNGTVGGSRQDLLHGLDPAKEHRDRLEFNQRVQEQRLLAEERRDWDRLSPDHGQLQAKVQQLYKLDRLLQEESGTLHSLQQDKEILEKALGGLRHKMQSSRSNPVETERYRKQQLLLERELSRVRLLLAHNSKKLEETVAENARLEQELVVLRQKLQASRRYAGNMARDPSGTTAALEAELRRVQQLVGDLQRQRQELSVQVRQLTEKSHSLVQQIRPQSAAAPQVHQSKKRTHSSWLETDLDSGTTLDHGLDSPSSPALSTSPRSGQNSHQASPRFKDPPAPYKENFPRYSPPIQDSQSFGQTLPSQNHISALSPQLREQIQQHQLKQQQLRDRMQGKGSPVQANVAPLYVNTESRRQDVPKHGEVGLSNGPIPPPEYVPPPPPPPSEEALLVNGGVYGHAEENKFPGLLHGREKQEIKTVRIVKRESERRQRDRGDRTGNLGIPLTNGLPVPGGAKRLAEEESSQQLEKAQLGRVVEESPMTHAQSTVQLSELDEVQFQRSMSLPRGFGGQRPQPGIHQGLLQGPVPPPPRSDSMNALRNMMARRHRVRQFEHQDASSDSTLSPYTESPTSTSMANSSPNYSTSPSAYSPSHQNYQAQGARAISNYLQVGPYGSIPSLAKEGNQVPGNSTAVSPVPPRDRFFGSAASINSLSESPQLSPVFKSEAARQIIKEMTEKRSEGPRRRQVPKEKRRHYTVSSSKPVFDLEDTFSKMGMGRARDDLDMERALRPRINAPDVVRSTLSHKELKYNESTIDQLLGTPNKILIPERYIPEQTPELSAEEQEHRLKKAESIRKMLSETAVTAPEGGGEDYLLLDDEMEKSDTLKKKVAEEKRQREHILQLNQILAKQVMEKSKMVAVQALATLPLNQEPSFDEDDLSPVTPLPLYQQRENYYS
ncbi:serine/arginine repetitive matrix protein 2 isoform X1 [Orussus abietinus]|uniref:serine/arginine repetitive matrix protein 2 isoform X1 n=1 Tax=Orussus abietinus TaxID=222816 RepID=UPI000C716236|nr:serine/arginine repetitive matrix protein 2 isoform X1 [Orussus abietinus]